MLLLSMQEQNGLRLSMSILSSASVQHYRQHVQLHSAGHSSTAHPRQSAISGQLDAQRNARKRVHARVYTYYWSPCGHAPHSGACPLCGGSGGGSQGTKGKDSSGGGGDGDSSSWLRKLLKWLASAVLDQVKLLLGGLLAVIRTTLLVLFVLWLSFFAMDRVPGYLERLGPDMSMQVSFVAVILALVTPSWLRPTAIGVLVLYFARKHAAQMFSQVQQQPGWQDGRAGEVAIASRSARSNTPRTDAVLARLRDKYGY